LKKRTANRNYALVPGFVFIKSISSVLVGSRGTVSTSQR